MPAKSDEGRTLLRKVRKDDYGFDLFESDNKSILFADGWSTFGISSSVSKVNFYQVVSNLTEYNSDDPSERRTVDVEARENFLTLTMSTSAWVRLAERILISADKNIEEISRISSESLQQIESISKKMGK